MQTRLAQSIRKIMGSGRNRAHDAAALALVASVLVGLVTTVEAAPRPAPNAPTVTQSQDAFADMDARFDARSRQMDSDFDARSRQMDAEFDARSAQMDRDFDARVAKSDRRFDQRSATMGGSAPTASDVERDHQAAVAGMDARHDEAVRRMNGAASDVEAHHLAAVADIDRHHRDAVDRMDSGSSLDETSMSATPSMADIPHPEMPSYGAGVPHLVDADATRDGMRTRVDEKRTVVRELRGDGVTVTHTTYETHVEMHGHIRGRLEMDDQPSLGLK